MRCWNQRTPLGKGWTVGGYLLSTQVFHSDPSIGREAKGIDAMHRGVGTLLLILGSAFVYEGSSTDRSPVGAGLGLFLVLAGSSLVLDLPPPEQPAP